MKNKTVYIFLSYLTGYYINLKYLGEEWVNCHRRLISNQSTIIIQLFLLRQWLSCPWTPLGILPIHTSIYSINGHVLLCNQERGYSSVVEHSTADREVRGSTPRAPCFLLKYFKFTAMWILLKSRYQLYMLLILSKMSIRFCGRGKFFLLHSPDGSWV